MCGPTSRDSWITGLVVLIWVLLLSIPVSVSLPYLPNVEIARAGFTGGTVQVEGTEIQELRFGIWTACSYDASSRARSCLNTGYAYTVHLSNTVDNQMRTVTISSGKTAALIIHPIATGITFLAFLCSLTRHWKLMVVARCLAVALFWAALGVDVAFEAYLNQQLDENGLNAGITAGGTGVWLTLFTCFLILCSGCQGPPPPPPPPVNLMAAPMVVRAAAAAPPPLQQVEHIRMDPPKAPRTYVLFE